MTQRVVAPFDVMGFAGQFADGVVLCSGNDTDIDHILVRITRRLLTIDFRNVGPQLPSPFATAIPDVKGNDLTALGLHCKPSPLLVRLLLHETRHFIGFDLKRLDHDVRVTRDRLDIEMIGQSLKLGYCAHSCANRR